MLNQAFITGVYYTELPQYVKIQYAAGLQQQASAEVLEKSLAFTTAALILGAFANTLLTLLIGEEEAQFDNHTLILLAHTISWTYLVAETTNSAADGSCIPWARETRVLGTTEI